MFYIQHGNDNFSIIDCSLPDDREDEILDEIAAAQEGKGITRCSGPQNLDSRLS